MPGLKWTALLPPFFAAGGALLWYGRVRGERSADALREDLWQVSDNEAASAFDVGMVEGLPEPAQRYLLQAIAPGAPLSRAVRLQMHGTIRLRPGADPLRMEADQVLAPHRGLVWKARVRKGWMRFRGFDSYAHGQGRVRWWAYGLVPVVNGSGTDVDRSAAGRVGGEAVLVPAALLPQFGVQWEAVDDARAMAILKVDGESVRLTLAVRPDGTLEHVRIQRWRGDVGGGVPGYDFFDVDEFSDERSFGGYAIPTRFRAGWRLGESDAFPFFHATIDRADYR